MFVCCIHERVLYQWWIQYLGYGEKARVDFGSRERKKEKNSVQLGKGVNKRDST